VLAEYTERAKKKIRVEIFLHVAFEGLNLLKKNEEEGKKGEFCGWGDMKVRKELRNKLRISVRQSI
jgi:hypothetical protein